MGPRLRIVDFIDERQQLEVLEVLVNIFSVHCMREVGLVCLVHPDEPLQHVLVLKLKPIIVDVIRVQLIAIFVEVIDLDTAEELQVPL